MADGTFHQQTFGNDINENFVFFTHVSNTTSTQSEIYFTGKELDYVPDGLPTDAWVDPEFTYVPD